jgi:curved DNA-binding protein
MDYYSTLGVSKNASDKELKSAYKKLSMQHHPDRTGGDDSKFKEINEAYSTLKDPQKRQEYDNPQPQGFGPNGFQGMGGFEDVFANFGFNMGGRQQRMQNDDITIAVEIEIPDIYTGKEYVVNYRLASNRMETVNIVIPPGIRPNDTIRYNGMGQDNIQGLPRGNLNVKVRVKASPDYQVNGIDLITIKDTNIFHLITGTQLEFKTPKGSTLMLNVKPKTPPGTRMAIPGYGLPDRKTGRTGKIIIELKGVIPKDIPDDLLNKIKEIW